MFCDATRRVFLRPLTKYTSTTTPERYTWNTRYARRTRERARNAYIRRDRTCTFFPFTATFARSDVPATAGECHLMRIWVNVAFASLERLEVMNRGEVNVRRRTHAPRDVKARE